MEKRQQSVVDFLIDVMPDLNRRINNFNNGINDNHANVLFSIWENENKKIGNKTFKKPEEVDIKVVESLERSGLIKKIGDSLKITQKGSDVIKTMILGDDKSAFDKKASIRYNEALMNTQLPSMVKKSNNDLLISKSASSHYTKNIKQDINKSLIDSGLDGNGRFDSISLALSEAGEVLQNFNLTFADVLNANLFLGDSGSRSLSLSTISDRPFENGDMVGFDLYFTWYKLDNNKYEIVAYLT